jgi:predicted nucleic acid-binding protein
MEDLFVDTNIFLRFLLKDDRKKAERCKNLFERARKDKVRLFTSDLVIAEVVWTLESFYELSKKEVSEKVKRLLTLKNLGVPSASLLIEALVIYEEKNIDFIDAYNYILMLNGGLKRIASYDEDFDRLYGIKRQEPQ